MHKDERHASLMQLLTRAATAKRKAFSLIQLNQVAAGSSPHCASSSHGVRITHANTSTHGQQVWYSDGQAKESHLPPWVAGGDLYGGKDMTGRTTGSTWTFSSHARRNGVKAACASSAVRFPDGLLLDETRYVHGMDRMDVPPKIPPSSFGKQAWPSRFSTPRLSW